jgi:hypothetical protein
MKATNWEFANRALLFGLIFAFSFPLYFLDEDMKKTIAAHRQSWRLLSLVKASAVIKIKDR